MSANSRAVDDAATRPVKPDDTVDGEITATVRVIRGLIAVLVIGALAAGVVRALTVTGGGADRLVAGLVLSQVCLAAVLILLGGFVEGFGFGLSLGTHWPATRNIGTLLLRGDPEAAHRITAGLVGVIGIVLAILAPNPATIAGLCLIIATGLFGWGTLHVLAGRMPSLVHGIHGLLAYGVLACYLAEIVGHGDDVGSFLFGSAPVRTVLVAVLLGGMTTAGRGFGKAIGEFTVPRRASHWTVLVHVLAALSVVSVLGMGLPDHRLAFTLAVVQVLVGFLLFHGVNLRPQTPGLLVATHHAMVIAILTAIVAA